MVTTSIAFFKMPGSRIQDDKIQGPYSTTMSDLGVEPGDDDRGKMDDHVSARGEFQDAELLGVEFDPRERCVGIQ